MELRSSDVETDAEPTPMAKIEFRKKLIMIDEHLKSRDLSSVKFLCQDLLPSAIIEQSSRGIDLFQQLEQRSKIGPKSLDLLLEILLRIGRNDVLRKLGFSAKELKAMHLESIPRFRSVLYEICEEISSRSLSEMKYMASEHLSRNQLDKIKSAEHLLIAMEQADVLSEDNTNDLQDILVNVNRSDLAEKLAIRPISITRSESTLPVEPSRDESFNLLGSASKNSTKMKVPPIDDMEEWNRRVQNMYIEQCAEKKRRELEDDEQESDPSQYTKDTLYNTEQVAGLEAGKAADYHPPGTFQHVPHQHIHDLRPDGLRNHAMYYGVQTRDPTTESPTECQSLPILPNDVTIDQGLSGSFDPFRSAPRRYVYQPIPHQPSYRDVSLYYEMSARPRGVCLIINNKKFHQIKDDPSSRRLPERSGSEIDTANLEYIFSKLHFNIRMVVDQTKEDMIDLMHRIALKEDHTRYDCFVCCVLSHGSVGSIYSSDGKEVAIKELTQPFKGVLCTGLRGKPKLFFIQACQGKEKQPGARENNDIEMDAPSMNSEPERGPVRIPTETLPNEADFLIGYATVPGFVSFRSRSQGSWYITKLTEMLDKYAHKHDLLSILIMVNNEVSKGIAPMPEADYKQSPAPLVTLRKKIFFY